MAALPALTAVFVVLAHWLRRGFSRHDGPYGMRAAALLADLLRVHFPRTQSGTDEEGAGSALPGKTLFKARRCWRVTVSSTREAVRGTRRLAVWGAALSCLVLVRAGGRIGERARAGPPERPGPGSPTPVRHRRDRMLATPESPSCAWDRTDKARKEKPPAPPLARQLRPLHLMVASIGAVASPAGANYRAEATTRRTSAAPDG